MTLRPGLGGPGQFDLDSPIWDAVSCGKYLGSTGTPRYCGAFGTGRLLCAECLGKPCPECGAAMREHENLGFGMRSHPRGGGDA